MTPTNDGNSTDFPSLLMEEGEGGGEHRVSPLTPALFPGGRGGKLGLFSEQSFCLCV